MDRRIYPRLLTIEYYQNFHPIASHRSTSLKYESIIDCRYIKQEAEEGGLLRGVWKGVCQLEQATYIEK